MDDLPDPCKQALRDLFHTLNLEANRFAVVQRSHAELVKRMIENGQKPSDVELTVIMDSILEGCQTYRSLMEEMRKNFPW